MKTVLSLIVVCMLAACAATVKQPVPAKAEVAPVVHSRTHCEPVGGPTSNKCR